MEKEIRKTLAKYPLDIIIKSQHEVEMLQNQIGSVVRDLKRGRDPIINDLTKNWVLKALNDLRVAGHELERPESEIVTDASLLSLPTIHREIVKSLPHLPENGFWEDTLLGISRRIVRTILSRP